MNKKSSLEKGWEFSAKLNGVEMSTQSAKNYVDKIKKGIECLEEDLLKIKSGRADSIVGGFAAETYHAGTFNINATAAGSKSVATAGKPGALGSLERNKYASVDVRVTTADGQNIDYGLKYDKNFKITAKEQATPNLNGNTPKYIGQKRLVPSDQVEQVRDYAKNRANNPKTPKRWVDGYQETYEKVTDRVSDGRVSSEPLSKEESEQIARDIRKGDINLDEYGVTIDDAIKNKYIIKQVAKAGLSASILTAIINTAPEIYKAIDFLIKTGEINLNQLKKVGIKAVTSSVEGFLRGAVACSLQILCEKGVFGNVFKKIDPTFLGVAVVLTVETIKNSILVAAGKISSKEMGEKLIDGVFVSSGFLVGTKLGATIGGVVGQVVGFKLPLIGYVLGSLIGCAFSSVYNIGKNKLISLCIDSGFSCFGLVNQNYQIPEALLLEMGVDITPILKIDVKRVEISRISIPRVVLGKKVAIETIDMHILRRGIIGVRKVGYIY